MAFAETFLIDPASFSRHTAEENAWGEQTVTIDFAGGPYRFLGLAASQEQAILQRFTGFETTTAASPAAASITTRILHCEQDLFRDVRFIDEDYHFDRQYAADAVNLAGSSFMGRISWQPEIRGAIWTSRASRDGFTIIFENFFRVLAAYRLLELGGMILHSGCVVHQGRAFLVIGHSGAGKSTFSAQARAAGWEVLSDDLNAVRCQDGTWMVEKLPFAGDLGQTPGRGSSYPLAGLYILRQSDRNAITPMNKGAAVAKALACSPIINDDPFRADRLVTGLHGLIRVVPAAELHFARDGEAVGLLAGEGEQA